MKKSSCWKINTSFRLFTVSLRPFNWRQIHYLLLFDMLSIHRVFTLFTVHRAHCTRSYFHLFSSALTAYLKLQFQWLFRNFICNIILLFASLHYDMIHPIPDSTSSRSSFYCKQYLLKNPKVHGYTYTQSPKEWKRRRRRKRNCRSFEKNGAQGRGSKLKEKEIELQIVVKNVSYHRKFYMVMHRRK